MQQRILITGASIAGNTLAFWLARAGFEVTVVERAPQFRDGGQNVDVRGAARTVLRRMGLEDAVIAQGTGEKGVRFVDEDGRAVAEFRVADLGSRGFTAEVEILRGTLARLIYDESRAHAHFRFGDAVAAIDDGAREATVTFASGAREGYDLVVIAEGVGSSTRELVFPAENQPRWMDVSMGYFTIPKARDDGDMARWFTADRGRSVLLRPDNTGTTRALLTVQGPSNGEEKLAPDAQKALLAARFADVGWETPRVLAGLAVTEDFYFDALRQVKMARWSKGRVVLTGDAAWCATPLSGIGTSLALIGAYVLAGELHAQRDIATALTRYERTLRPFVDRGQRFPKFGARLVQPQTRVAVKLQRAVLGVAAAPGVRQLVGKLITPRAEKVDLPPYAMPS